ncbi:hypothetical protein EV690_2583 [Celerinatantimonas diazotrophica]|uniref:Uncharacterized protein n=1 Tax=Celerinatantimonas diazotrophica TaxID=412034 RepID=A0A4V2PNL9_9GAMM|nr:hypothetical protein EV690_2583 [Celerinatantimonas diazotrophica]CAG9296831.1 hypothetical protein CEDIAZO_01989 [Celerinatantimonas diazotrophica]
MLLKLYGSSHDKKYTIASEILSKATNIQLSSKSTRTQDLGGVLDTIKFTTLLIDRIGSLNQLEFDNSLNNKSLSN